MPALDSSKLDQALQSHSLDVKSVNEILRQAKISLVQNHLLVASAPQASPHALQQAQNILEKSALLSLRINDIPQFERFIAQLEPFSAPSAARPKLVGLHLLLLLSRNEIGSFHTQLERMADTDAALLEDALVQYPIQLEKWLMEGSFSKVWQARSNPPTQEYKPFLDHLMVTVRNEIASCAEQAYASLPMQDAATLLFFAEMKDLMQFAANRPTWQTSPTKHVVTFNKHPAQVGIASAPEHMATGLDRQAIISATVAYAKELEVII